MNKIAVAKARARLQKAHECFGRKQHIKNFKEFESVWTDLLLAGNSVHGILEQGAKISPQSRQWFGGKKTERRQDPLLSYMHQARNSDEHGLESVTVSKPGGIIIGKGGGPVHIEHMEVSQDGIKAKFLPVDGKYPTIEIFQPHAELAAVTDTRYGTRFEPPTEHLGNKLTDGAPFTVAAVWLSYLDALVAEAEGIAT